MSPNSTAGLKLWFSLCAWLACSHFFFSLSARLQRSEHGLAIKHTYIHTPSDCLAIETSEEKLLYVCSVYLSICLRVRALEALQRWLRSPFRALPAARPAALFCYRVVNCRVFNLVCSALLFSSVLFCSAARLPPTRTWNEPSGRAGSGRRRETNTEIKRVKARQGAKQA